MTNAPTPAGEFEAALGRLTALLTATHLTGDAPVPGLGAVSWNDLRLLAAQPSAGAEPVAWIAVWNDGTRYGEPHSWPPLEGARTYHGLMSRTIQPLYTHPAPVHAASEPEGGAVTIDALADWLVERERQSRDAARQHSAKAPAKHFCSGKEAAFREVSTILWNSPEWFAALATREEAPAETDKSLLRPAGWKPTCCYCPPDRCGAPVIMGRQTPCLRAQPQARSGEDQ